VRKPNFFIIGAPKCGTTSWSSWLAEHPQICFSSLKEPCFFNTDNRNPFRATLSQYEWLFRGAIEEHHGVGEASVQYLFSRDAVANIERYTTNRAKYIVCLRNPVDMAHALHAEHLFNGTEQIENFHRAWSLSDLRLRGQFMSRWYVYDPALLAYKNVCSLGEQIGRLYAQVPKERVHLVLLDDVIANPRETYLSVLAFLGVADDGRTRFPAENQSRRARLPWLTHLPRFFMQIKAKYGITWNFRVGEAIYQVNTIGRPRPSLSPELRAELQDYFREDILLLANLLERDLSHWLEPGNATQTQRHSFAVPQKLVAESA
jgi:hypothetical protein